MRVSDDQLIEIQGYLMSEGVTQVSLQEDLVDHYSCVIEELMSEGKAFQSAFSEAKNRIAPEGAQELQEDLNYLLTIKKKLMLRKLVFVFGFFGMLEIMLALALSVAGFIETDLAGLLVMAGILTLSVSVLPFWFFQLYKRSANRVQGA